MASYNKTTWPRYNIMEGLSGADVPQEAQIVGPKNKKLEMDMLLLPVAVI